MSFLRRRLTRVVSGLLLSGALIGATASAASAGTAYDKNKTRQRADFIMSQNYTQFPAYAGWKEAPFDWSTDGCTLTPAPWNKIFKPACVMHDFGYRNYGNHGATRLRLDPSSARRQHLDNRFLEEMRRICFYNAQIKNCESGAKMMYNMVRRHGAQSFD